MCVLLLCCLLFGVLVEELVGVVLVYLVSVVMVSVLNVVSVKWVWGWDMGGFFFCVVGVWVCGDDWGC